MNSSDVLRAVLVPVPGQNHINLNLFSEAATGYASYLATHGYTDKLAINTANTAVSTWIGFDDHAITPVQTDTTATLDSPHEYGLLLGGAVSFLYNAAVIVDHQTFGTAPYNTVTFARMMSNDLAFDGVLDGVGDDGTGKPAPLNLGSQAVTTATYRHAIAAFAAMENRLMIPMNIYPTFVPYLVAVNNSNESLFGSAPLVSLDEGGATFLNNTFSSSSTVSGSYHLSTYFTDVVGVSNIEVLVDNIHYTYMLYDRRYYGQATADVNTTIFKNGSHTISVKITNLIGSVTTQSGTLTFQNDCTLYPTACT